jgi:hypothetical protein
MGTADCSDLARRVKMVIVLVYTVPEQWKIGLQPLGNVVIALLLCSKICCFYSASELKKGKGGTCLTLAIS